MVVVESLAKELVSKARTTGTIRNRRRRFAMTAMIAETTLWQRNLASLIRSGLFHKAEVIAYKGLHAIVGVYDDGSYSAPLAQYGDPRRAEDALAIVRNLVEPAVAVEVN
jgi:hypothetical protein